MQGVCKCGNRFEILMESGFRERGSLMQGAVTVVVTKCKKCGKTNMISIPHKLQMRMTKKKEESD